MDMKQKSQSLANKMNKLTEKFSDSLDNAEELELTGDDIIEYAQEKTQDIALFSSPDSPDIISLQMMIEDFKFVRDTLKENTENGRKILTAVTADLLDSDEEKRANLILSFAELNKAVALNMKLYISSYKEISQVILNLEKVKQAESNVSSPHTVNNTLNINNPEAISTVDVIKKLNGNK